MRDIDKLESLLWGAMKTLETIKIEMVDYMGHETLADGELITGPQCRGGRNMIRMRNTDLADISNVGAATVSKFETSDRACNLKKEENLRLRSALEKGGVVFYADGSVGLKAK